MSAPRGPAPRPTFYILGADGRTPVAVDPEAPSDWRRTPANSTVGQALLMRGPDKRLVSTVFLGVDHAFDDGPPMLFETMSFEGETPGPELSCDRCSTWTEAYAQHRRVVGALAAEGWVIVQEDIRP